MLPPLICTYEFAAPDLYSYILPLGGSKPPPYSGAVQVSNNAVILSERSESKDLGISFRAYRNLSA